MFKTIKENTTAEIVEKKSKFIANAIAVESAGEAEERIKEINKKYFDSKHNCYAYSVFTKNGVVNRFSDNGEPSGTAGAPMLNILTSKELTNVLVVVTRYFGGILLGTGGLVRAYSQATELALSKTEIVKKDLGLEINFEISYSDLQKLQYYFEKRNIKILENRFEENVTVTLEATQKFIDEILENQNNLNFKILKYEILREKFIICEI